MIINDGIHKSEVLTVLGFYWRIMEQVSFIINISERFLISLINVKFTVYVFFLNRSVLL